ncbi:MAG: 4-hydroxythreonine-4-phosphate dehydrogenase PdxA [Wenzhouxiangella sp.]|nr:4-hydroxythreonine-4-phosphate dehydrogenase PdxA [Wenzhouxiangella sp.]
MAPRLLLTPGEPAGIGPEIACRLALERPALCLVADPTLIKRSLARLGLAAGVRIVSAPDDGLPGQLSCLPVTMAAPETPGKPDPANADYLLKTLRLAAGLCLQGRADGLVTGPIHKGVINDAGIAFSGHTEFLAELAGVDKVVMMLVAGTLRVALATTHLPLARVPQAITPALLSRVLGILDHDLRTRFRRQQPRIAVLGLNPHAGEGGHLGREEIEIIAPELERLRARGLDLVGPLPADTAFVPKRLDGFDAVLAMYHDQGLPVLKFAGFGQAVNITLGLPFVRTSVDHGTALDIAGSGRADAGSLAAAVDLAAELASR